MEVKLNKLKSTLEEVVHYQLISNDDTIDINDLIGKEISMTFHGKTQCKSCGDFKKLFAQGFCYNCFLKAPEASPCIINPELCEGHLGKGRDVEWEKANHVQPHVVYLAVSSDLKIGVTRESQVPTRWIDQGASFAIVVAEVPYRKIAGDIEVALKGTFTDKTNWRNMLKNVVIDVDLEDEKWQIEELLPMDLAEYMSEDDTIWEINYPVSKYPEKVVSVGFDKQAEIKGTLSGVKGQYFIFDDGRVLNIRKHEGYYVDFKM
ncbi:DUF2797 domain-containing protein [Paracrocinitomix mangrovi]|uniref:DUF2797 domain-containing protein n=1 Tax=Paracrocinitomix mangrovi TaxID=2862509 RepID=UPI001C8D3A0A|nr:DUF2797 domain-containing protein [Paracrocinitomix mangrovi]UKN03627.1 DUF2797 domain-containing protein [Paracrocinitomix mangrovi]